MAIQMFLFLYFLRYRNTSNKTTTAARAMIIIIPITRPAASDPVSAPSAAKGAGLEVDTRWRAELEGHWAELEGNFVEPTIDVALPNEK